MVFVEQHAITSVQASASNTGSSHDLLEQVDRPEGEIDLKTIGILCHIAALVDPEGWVGMDRIQ